MSDDLFDDLLAELGVDSKPYEIRARTEYQVLVLDENFLKSIDQLQDEVVNKIAENGKPTVIRFGSDSYQQPEVALKLFQLAERVSKNVPKIRMVPGKQLPKTLSKFGSKDLRNAVEALGGTSGGEIPWDFVELFKDATLQSVAGQLNLKADVTVLGEGEKSPLDDAKGHVYKSLIALDGESIKGAAIISMEQQTLLGLMSKMLGAPQTSANDAVVNGVAELVNLVAGRAKGSLNELGYQVKLASLPKMGGTVEYDVALKPLEGAQSVKIQFKTPDGSFELELKVLPSFAAE